MGRFLLGVGILTFFLTVGIWINSYIGSICQPLSQDLSAAVTEDFPAAQARTQKAARQWQLHQPLLAVFFDHTPLSNIDEGFSRLAVCTDDEEFFTTCAVLSRELSALCNTHRPNWWNLL